MLEIQKAKFFYSLFNAATGDAFSKVSSVHAALSFLDVDRRVTPISSEVFISANSLCQTALFQLYKVGMF